MEEELEAIKAIFMDDVTIEETGGRQTLNLAVDGHRVLALSITGNYPDAIPEIVLPEHLKTLGLREHVAGAAESSIGSPMLYQILDAAREWITSHPLSLYPTSGLPEASAQDSTENQSGIVKQEATTTAATICKYYLKGNCKFGDGCRNSHGSASSKTEQQPSSAATSKERDSVSVSAASTPSIASKTEKKPKRGKNSGTKSGLVSDSPLDSTISQEETKSKKAKPKKSPKQLQEAEDDESAKKVAMRQATDVISRILWDPDLPSEEFTVGYLDRFVGIMEKPFSAFSWEDISTVGASVLAVPKHRIQYFKYRDEIVWDKRCQMDNFFGSRGGRVIQDIVEKVQKDSATDSTEATSASESVETAENVTMEIEVEDVPEVSRIMADKSRPNHFVCIHVTDEEVKVKVQEVQEHITGHTPQLAEGCLVPTALHVTLCMVRLENEPQIEAARRVLEEAKQQFIHVLPRCLHLSFSGVDNFRGRLVYVKVDPCPALERFVFYLLNQLQQAGIRTPGNRDQYTPHMTVVKLSRPMQRELHTTLISPASYVPFRDVRIGRQRVKAVQLCSMTEPKQSDGFYLRQASISNSLSSLLPAFASLVLERVQFLFDHGIITENERDQLNESLRAGPPADVDKFDAAVEELLRVGSEETMCSRSDATQQTTVVILRGLPGSGKSFLAHNCSEFLQEPSKVAICAADDYFMEGDSYRFDSDLLPKAHSFCLNQFLIALGGKKELIVVDNTNSKLWEYQIYLYLCKILGCGCHVVEVYCPNALVAEMYRSRNVHNVDPAATTRILQRWDKDEGAVLVPPSLAYPTMRSAARTAFLLKSLCLPEGSAIRALASYSSLKVVYTAIFLSPESQWQLVSMFAPGHPRVFATHVTLTFEPGTKRILETGIGKKVSLRVTGCADNGKIQVVTVEFPKMIPSENKHPHITISTEEGVSPKLANVMLRTHPLNPMHRSGAISLEGVIGIMVREVNEMDLSPETQAEKPDLPNQPSFAITSGTDFHNHVLPKLFENVPNAPAKANESELADLPPADITSTNICTGHQKINQLFIFDFDGTLFCPPEPREGKEFYEAYTGRTWPHKGWLSWPESLLPPMKINPGPALSEFRQHSKRAGSFTVILTARIKRTEKALVQVLDNAQVYPDRLIPKPDVSSDSSPAFKARIVQQLLEEFPDVTLVKFWDDSPDNLAAVHRLSKPNVQFEIINANTMLPTVASKQGKKTAQLPKATPSQRQPYSSVLEDALSVRGLLPNPAYCTAATSGTKFLASQFSKVVGFSGDTELFHHYYIFGSFPLGRQSDIDLCFLAPPSFTPKDCMEKFARQLQDCGVNYIHAGHSSRCPRLKIMLEFSDSPAIDYDIVFAIVDKAELFSSPPSQQLEATKALSLLKAGDSASKVALTGPVFLQHIQEIITGTVSRHQFGAVVEMVAQVLIAHRVKGNAYHCIRTFHVVQLLADFIKSHKAELPSPLCCDTLFKEFITHASRLPETKWQKLFGEFVPYEYIPRVLRAFSLANREVSHDDFPSVTCYEEMTDRPAFPPKECTVVELSLSGTKEALLWKLHTIVEARLPSYIRQLLSAGLDVTPDGNVRNERKFCFAVPHTKSSKQMLQQTLRPFWNELSEFRKQSGVNVELTFGQDAETPTATPGTSSTLGTGTASGACIEQIMQFVSGSSSKELRLTDTLSGYERLLVHETAERLGLQHTTVGTGKHRHIVLVKK